MHTKLTSHRTTAVNGVARSIPSSNLSHDNLRKLGVAVSLALAGISPPSKSHISKIFCLGAPFKMLGVAAWGIIAPVQDGLWRRSIVATHERVHMRSHHVFAGPKDTIAVVSQAAHPRPASISAAAPVHTRPEVLIEISDLPAPHTRRAVVIGINSTLSRS